MDANRKASDLVAQTRSLIKEKQALREIRLRAGFSAAPAKPVPKPNPFASRRRPM